MGTYGLAVYGEDTYGGTAAETGLVDFDVSPFVANSVSYEAIRLTWTSPGGDWDEFRLLKNRYGYATHETDGEIVLDTTAAANTYLDNDVVPGDWHYYTIFLLISGDWVRVGTASTLMIRNYDYAGRLFSGLPNYYQLVPSAVGGDYNQPNLILAGFLQAMALPFDYIKTYYDLLLYLNDPMRCNLGNLANLAAQFGIEFEASAPARLFRQRVANAGYLGRQKGTVEGIRNLVNLTTGWDVQIDMGPNLMLNEDQAAFYHPVYAPWDPTVNYPLNTRVTYQGFVYQAKANAYGASTAPSGSSSTNTWWTIEQNLADQTLANLLGWAVVYMGTIWAVNLNLGVLGVGYQTEVDSSVDSSNVLVIQNSNSSNNSLTLGARSVGDDTNPINPITQGIPLPNITEPWDSTRQYFTGDTAMFHGRPVRALTDSLNVSPNSDASSNGTWEPLGFDERPFLMISMFAQGAAGTYVNAYPFIDYYDQFGKKIITVQADALPAWQVWDSFTANWGNLAGRVADVGGLTWSSSIGAWQAGSSDNGIAYSTGSGQQVATVTRPSTPDATVAVTFDSDPNGGRDQGLVLRYKSDQSHLFAGRGSLYSVTAGTKTLIANYSASFAAGDRMTVVLSGTSIIVKKNGTQVLSTTSSFNSTQVTYGIGVE